MTDICFFIRDDEVQVDKAMYFLNHQQIALTARNKELAQENRQLKNRPDTVYDPPKTGMVVKYTKGSKINMDKPVAAWNVQHFLRLFQNLYKVKYSQDFSIRDKQWQVFAIRISQFRNMHEMIQDNAVYKEMIEWLFAKKFNKKFVASIPLISSDTMMYQWLATTKERKPVDPDRFKQLAAQTPKSTKALDKSIEDAF